MPGNTRLIDDPLPEFVTTYLETDVDRLMTTLSAIEFQVKDAKDTEKAKALFQTLRTQMMAHQDALDAVKSEINTLSDAEGARALNVVSDKETAMLIKMVDLTPLLLDLKGGRRRAKTGRRVQARTTRRGRGRS
jgi:hypothetical protein